jgi:hypothetical protein
MNVLKFILFIEFIVMFVVAGAHLISLFTSEKFPVELYLIISIITLACCLFVIYIFVPIADFIIG